MKAQRTKTIDVDLYGALGSGSTKTDARTSAEAKIRTAFADDGMYCPEMHRFPRGEVATVYRILEGWTYAILWPTQTRQTFYGQRLSPNKREARGAMLRHIAQDYWDDEPTAYGHDLLAATDDEGRKDQTRYRQFQRAYRHWKSLGFGDTECHRMACDSRYMID